MAMDPEKLRSHRRGFFREYECSRTSHGHWVKEVRTCALADSAAILQEFTPSEMWLGMSIDKRVLRSPKAFDSSPA